jgi:ABC-type antimicrobial peptide transport system permease subunit
LDERDRFDFTEGDRMPAHAVVNRSFARRFFPRGDAVGKHFGIGDRKHELGVEITGVVDDALFAGPRQGLRPTVYFSYLEANYPIDAAFYVRTAADPETLFPELRRIVARHDATLPVEGVKTLQDQLGETLSTERLVAFLSALFGVLAAIMAALGIHGVLNYLVTRRSKEIGLRMALGAARAPVVWLVTKEALLLTGCGVLAGLPAALFAIRLFSTQLFGIQPGEWRVFAGAVAIVFAVAAVAAFVPVRRAVGTDPLAVLRHE